jgi:hypothetical protein
MDPNEITLESIGKLFEYEKHARMIDEMNFEELKNFAKSYCKLYLRQQEVLVTLGMV